ncbi:hypothetical protein BH20VER2_BH20VER2_04940 [soil metagenome]
MTITETVKDVVAETAKELREDPRFVELERFYASMKRQGLVRKQHYSLPLIDTIGYSAGSENAGPRR